MPLEGVIGRFAASWEERRYAVGRLSGRPALAYGFETLGLGLIFAITLPDNVASQAVMKRIGLGYRKRVDYRGFKDVVWFDKSRD